MSIGKIIENVLSILKTFFERQKTKEGRDASKKLKKYRDRVRDADIKRPDEL